MTQRAGGNAAGRGNGRRRRRSFCNRDLALMLRCDLCPVWLRFGLLLLVCVTGHGWADQDARAEGERLARQVHERREPRDAVVSATVTLTELGREARQRQMYSYRARDTAGKIRSLIRFTAPSDVRDIGLLTLDQPGNSPRQWLYLPALDRLRSVPADGRGGRFLGSDFYYEDMIERDVLLDRHHLVGREDIGGVTTAVLESVPIDPASSVYTRRLSWIHPEALLPLRVDYFMSRNDAPVKRYTVHRLDKVQGYWTIMDATMTELESGHQTRIRVNVVKYDAGLPDSLFSQETLRHPAREEPFRLEQ